VKRFLPVLHKIDRLGDKAKRDYVKKCDTELVHCLSECAKNLLFGTVPLTEHQFKRLRSQKKNLRALSLKKTSLKKKRKLLQRGGFIGLLIRPILSLLGGLLSGSDASG